MTENRHPAEALADMLGDPLPADWRDALAIQARQDLLATLAYGAADAAVELIIRFAELQGRGERLTVDDKAIVAWLDALFALDRGWRKFVHDTQRGDAGKIVYEAADWAAGSLIAAFVEGILDRVRDDERQVIAEIYGAH